MTIPSIADVVGGSLYQANHDHAGELCDCIAAWDSDEGPKAVTIELKSGRPDVKKAARQLQEGADLLAGWLDRPQDVEFMPYLIHGRGIDTMEYRELLNTRVVFDGSRYRIRPERCGYRIE